MKIVLWRLEWIRWGYKPTQQKIVYNPTISAKAFKVDRVQGQYVSLFFAVPKSKRHPNKWRSGSRRIYCVLVQILRMTLSMSP